MVFNASQVDKLHVAEFLTKNEGKKCKKHIGQWMLFTSEGYICKKKNICLYLETVLRNKDGGLRKNHWVEVS